MSVVEMMLIGVEPTPIPPEVPDVMNWLASDPERVAEFFNRLGAGMWDEWDCGIGRGLGIFGEMEFALALKSGAMIKYAPIDEDPNP